MRIDRTRFLYAVRGFGGWIDRKNGNIICRGWMGDPDALFTLVNGEIVLLDADKVRERELLEIPRLCPGYVELAFLKRHEKDLSGFLKAYGLEQYMKETLPVFLEADTGEAIIQAGQRIWNRTLMLREEQGTVWDMFESDAIEDTILDKWCKENGIQLINK